MDAIDRAHKCLGEFVVCFQWVENKYREIGWFILDPERKNWPPMAFRKDRTKDIIDRVTKLYLDLVDAHDLPTADWRRADMLDLQSTFHQIRRFRNVLVHSAYQEMKAGGEVIEMLRANPNPVVDSETGEISFEVEAFTEENISARLKQLAEPSFRLGQHYVQLIHWAPFQRFLRRPSTT